MSNFYLSISNQDLILFISLVIFIAAFVHGSIGFAFAMISTPVLAMKMNLSNAIMLTLLPTIFLNAISISSTKGWTRLVQKHFSFAFLALLGSIIGTLVLLIWDARWMKLLLSLMIILYLTLEKLEADLEFLNRHKRVAFISFSLVGGILGGITNNMSPILIIYTLLKHYSKDESIVFMNTSFLLGKLSQIIVFLIMGHWLDGKTLFYTIVPAFIGFFIGAKVKKYIPNKTYVKIVKVILLLIAIAIVIRYINNEVYIQ